MEFAARDFVRASGKQFFYGDQPIVFKGLGVGSWLNLEHFMVGLPGADSVIRETFAACYGQEKADAFFADFAHAFFAEEDVLYLKSLGVNFIRVPINYHLFYDDQQGCYREEGFTYLRRLAELCEKHGLFFMPDLHAAPGSQNPDWHSDSRGGTAEFWRYKVFRTQAAALWQEIASRLAGYSYLMGYDLLNEPVLPPGSAALLNEFYREVITAIRAVDPHHLILLEGDRFAMDFSRVALPNDINIAYTFHYYPTVWEEDLLTDSHTRAARRETFQKALEEILSSMQGYQGPLLCGEAGYELALLEGGFGMELLSDTLSLFASKGISYCLWAYKDIGLMGLTCPKADTPWMALADKIQARWDHHLAMRRGSESMREMLTRYFGKAEEALVYQLQFRLRALLYMAEAEYVLLPLLKALPFAEAALLPGSFTLKHCRIREDYAALMKGDCL